LGKIILRFFKICVLCLARKNILSECMQLEGIDKVIKSNRKSVALNVLPSGEVVLRIPKYMPKLMVKLFLKQNQTWLEKHKLKIQERLVKAKKFVEGEKFFFLGEEYPLEFVAGKKLELRDEFRLGKEAKKNPKEMFEQWYKQEFREIAEDRVKYFANLGGYKYTKVRISGARTRWGSRSTTGTISLVWRLAMLPLEIIDYVVLHELAHTIHMNHSKDFWAEVEKWMPDYKERRRWLKKEGSELARL